MERVKTIEEVNEKIPEIQEIFERIAELNEQSVSLSKDIQNLFDIWGGGIRREKNPDFCFYQEKVSKKNSLNQEIQEGIEKIQDLGGVVKDLQKGLVDFYFERGREGVYLCWKRGEEKVTHWHPLRGGFATRRPIEELFQASSI